jgi:hypothetical protein
MKQKIFLFIIFILAFSGYASAQNDGAGNTGLAFLKLGVGPKSIGMGEAVSSYVDDATAVIYNPSRLNFGLDNNVILIHNMNSMDLSNTFLGAKFITGRFAFGFGILKSSVEDIEIRTMPGEAIDKFNSQNLSVNLGIGYKIKDNISIGLTGKLLYEKIYVDEASGYAFDFGTNYNKDNFSVSFVLANIGSMNELRNSRTKLPASFRFGGSYIMNYKKFSIGLGLDTYKILDGGALHIFTGADICYNNILSLRLGYQSGFENKGISTGIGIKYGGINLDYSLIPYSSGFGTGNTFSIGFVF